MGALERLGLRQGHHNLHNEYFTDVPALEKFT